MAANRPHAVMVPFLFQGHITPTVHLAIKLASKGCTVTFVQTKFLHHCICKAAAAAASRSSFDDDEEYIIPTDIFLAARESGLDIRYATISDGFPLEFDRLANFDEFWGSILRDFPTRVDEFVGQMMEDSTEGGVPPSFLVADATYLWAAQVAHKNNLVCVSFKPESALVLSVGYHLDLLRLNGHFPTNGVVDEVITYIPGVESIRTRDLMAFLEGEIIPSIPTILYQNFVDAYEQVKTADFILCNTVQELEQETLSALNQKQPTYAVGPTNFHPMMTTAVAANHSQWAEVDCQKWLEHKPHGSVLYVSFGSTIETSMQVAREIAHGLMLSQVSFIWILRPDLVIRSDGDDDGDDVLPPGFEDCVRDRGLVIPWCNQALVLSNPRIGCFLTHCGWNSILESIWYGVPMICYPLISDQPTNRKLVVDDWKIGVNLCDDRHSIQQICYRQQVAEKIDSLMMSTSTGASSGILVSLREEMKKVKKIVHQALAVGGSSDTNLDQFLTDLKAYNSSPQYES